MTDSDETPSKWKLAAYLVIAFVVALSWLSLAFVLDVDPRGFAVSSGDGATDIDEPAENVTVDELREVLTRTNHGGDSSVTMTVIWATEPYFRAAGLDADTYEVSPGENHVFMVFLDTHTQSLPEIDWTSEATLDVDGETYEPVDGRRHAGGFHHSVAVVEFPSEVDGEPMLTDGTEEVTLSVVGLERMDQGIPNDRIRRVSWSYPPPFYDADPGAFQNSECDCAESSAQIAGASTTDQPQMEDG